jgi:myo-inositol 2-dehydrogenase/D-chiro-inositol 1-dehydrogenase
MSVRVGFVGVGRIGAAHAAVVARHPEVSELVVGDADPARAAQVAGALGATPAGAIDDVLAAGVDALMIAANTSAHGALIVRGCEAGLPVFCEKPVALDVEGTIDVVERVRAAGVPVQIGFQRRFDAGYATVRASLAAGELGELRRVHLLSADREPPDASYIPGSGGIFRDCHVHDFDVLRWVTGREVVEAYATGANRGAEFFGAAGDVDESAALLTLDDGTLVTMQGSRYNGGGYDVRMEVYGTAASAAAGLGTRTPLRCAELDGGFPGGEPWPGFWERFTPAYEAEIDAFVEVALGRRETPCSVEDALEALYAAEAADLSRREHRPVAVAEVRR